ncbi:MAG TPA: hypothetical protein VEG39_13015 [Clostridia bacterium]|nr:hypothetical protein [Clostridia bacterium]
MDDIQEIKNIACGLLNRNLEPVQSLIIMRDLLDVSKDDSLLIEEEEKVMCSKWVKELEETQKLDGTWGRFHSQDSSIKRKFPTTEIAVNRALSLGLKADSSILSKCVAFMVRIINGADSWPDRVEKFDEWPVMTKIVTAATLSRVDRNHSDLENIWKLWAEITESAFETGEHNADRELAAFEEVTKLRPTNRDSKLNKMYPLILLSATSGRLNPDIEKSYLEWIWNSKEGIYYLTWFSMDILPYITSKEFPFWLRAIDIIIGYGYGKVLVENSIDYLWSIRKKDGLWDFGAASKSADYARSYCGWHLSGSWREPVNRQIDCTIRILLLLKKYYSH